MKPQSLSDKPLFVSKKHQALWSVIEQILQVAKEHLDAYYQESLQEIESIYCSKKQFKKDLLTVLEEHVFEFELPTSVSRWEVLKAAQLLRDQTTWSTQDDFEAALQKDQNEPVSSLRQGLYADLSEFRKLIGVKPLTTAEIATLYNQHVAMLFIWKNAKFIQNPSDFPSQKKELETWFHQNIGKGIVLGNAKKTSQKLVRIDKQILTVET